MRRFAASLQGLFEMRKSLAVLLAAGEGKRMKSRLPKVLHDIGRLPMIAHVLRALNEAGVDRIAVVIGPGHEAVAKSSRRMPRARPSTRSRSSAARVMR
jgi:bifunctional UDP-N-acetylglucosamine pyrophosphorylase/glucosamine-1-phosphate N-acetyltransferase